MNRSPLPPATSRVSTAMPRWALGTAAGFLALFLMVVYVRLLQDAVARGAQWRYSQATAQPSVASVGSGTSARIRLVSTSR